MKQKLKLMIVLIKEIPSIKNQVIHYQITRKEISKTIFLSQI